MDLTRVGIIGGCAALSGIGAGIGLGAAAGLCTAGVVSNVAETFFNAWHDDRGCHQPWYRHISSGFSEIVGANGEQKYYQKLRERDVKSSPATMSLLAAMAMANSVSIKIFFSVCLLFVAILADVGLKKN